jgi:hypothetical protein
MSYLERFFDEGDDDLTSGVVGWRSYNICAGTEGGWCAWGTTAAISARWLIAPKAAAGEAAKGEVGVGCDIVNGGKVLVTDNDGRVTGTGVVVTLVLMECDGDDDNVWARSAGNVDITFVIPLLPLLLLLTPLAAWLAACCAINVSNNVCWGVIRSIHSFFFGWLDTATVNLCTSQQHTNQIIQLTIQLIIHYKPQQ